MKFFYQYYKLCVYILRCDISDINMVFLDTEVYKGQRLTDSGFLDFRSYTILTMVLYFLG